MPTRTFPALHGWRRCGKRSTAPRATPQSTISSENRWFSRCSGCLRKRRGKRSVSGAIPSIPVELLLGIVVARKKPSKKKKTKKVSQRAAKTAASKKRAKKSNAAVKKAKKLVKKAKKTARKSAAKKTARKSVRKSAKKPKAKTPV